MDISWTEMLWDALPYLGEMEGLESVWEAGGARHGSEVPDS